MLQAPSNDVADAARCNPIARRRQSRSFVHASTTRVSAAYEICGSPHGMKRTESLTQAHTIPCMGTHLTLQQGPIRFICNVCRHI